MWPDDKAISCPVESVLRPSGLGYRRFMSVAPGWLADPTGRHQLRYWDGRQWTSHVSDGGVQGSDSPTSGHPSGSSGVSVQVGGTAVASTCSHQAASAEAHFCPSCGQKFAAAQRTCLWCGQQTSANDYCERCGAHRHALTPGLSLPRAQHWANWFADLGWTFENQPNWGLFKAHRDAMNAQLGAPGINAAEPWLFGLGVDTSMKPKPGVPEIVRLVGSGIHRRESTSKQQLQRMHFVAATRSALAVSYFETNFNSVISSKSRPPKIAVIPFAALTGASYSDEALTLSTADVGVQIVVRPIVTWLAKLDVSIGLLASIVGVATSSTQLERNAHLWMGDRWSGRQLDARAAEEIFRTVMTTFADDVLRVAPS